VIEFIGAVRNLAAGYAGCIDLPHEIDGSIQLYAREQKVWDYEYTDKTLSVLPQTSTVHLGHNFFPKSAVLSLCLPIRTRELSP
jgi:hypothetical protein